jgi:hypothetical protein
MAFSGCLNDSLYRRVEMNDWQPVTCPHCQQLFWMDKNNPLLRLTEYPTLPVYPEFYIPPEQFVPPVHPGIPITQPPINPLETWPTQPIFPIGGVPPTVDPNLQTNPFLSGTENSAISGYSYPPVQTQSYQSSDTQEKKGISAGTIIFLGVILFLVYIFLTSLSSQPVVP